MLLHAAGMLLLISLTLFARWYQGGPTSMGSEPAAPAAGGVACPATITLITINPDPNAVRNAGNAHASTAERRLR